MDLSAEFVRNALARGDRAFGALDGDLLVSYAWYAFRFAPHTVDVYVRIKPPRHYGYKAFTRRSHRGRNIMGAISLYGDSILGERGYEAQIMFVNIANFASLASQVRSGSRRVGLAGYLQRCGLFLSFSTAAVREMGFAFYRNPRNDSDGH